MNQKNLEDVKEALKDLGFGNKLYPDLDIAMMKNARRFSLLDKSVINNLDIKSSIHFEKSDQSDKYRITKYDAMVDKHDDIYENKIQTFYIHQNKGMSLKEAFNLLEGRSVLKQQADKESKWIKLDFSTYERSGNFIVKNFGQDQGFDLQKSLAALPIKEMQNGQSNEMLIRSLQKGNLEPVTILAGNTPGKMFVEANPEGRTVNVYDDGMDKVNKESLVQRQSNGQQKQDQKNDKAIGKGKELVSGNTGQHRSRKRGIS